MPTVNQTEITWDGSPQKDWTALNLQYGTAPNPFSTVAPTDMPYIGSLGRFAGDSGGQATSREKQQASMANDSSDFTGDTTVAYASFAFRIDRVQLSTSGITLTDVTKHRDFLVWSRFRTAGGAEILDNVGSLGGINGTPFKFSCMKIGSTVNVFLAHIEAGVLATIDPPSTSPMPIGGMLDKWLGMEWVVRIRRNPNATYNWANGIRVDARIWLLDTKRPRPITTLKIDYDVPEDPFAAGAKFTQSHEVVDVLFGARKLQFAAATDDEIFVDYDELRAGIYPVAMPRQLYGQPFKSQVSIGRYDKSGGTDEFRNQWRLPFHTEAQLNFREHGFETDAQIVAADPEVISAELGTVSTVAGTQTSTQFPTTMAVVTKNFYVGREVEFTSGTLKGQSSTITAYNSPEASTKYITVSPAFTAAPADNDRFVVRKTYSLEDRLRERVRNQDRLEVIASDANSRTWLNPTYTSPAGVWGELGPIWWSGFVDKIEVEKRAGRKRIALHAYGPSDFYRKTRSQYWKNEKSSLSTYIGGNWSFDDALHVLPFNYVETFEPTVPFEIYGEEYQAVAETLSRLLGDYSFGLYAYAYRNGSFAGVDTYDYQELFLANRDDVDHAWSDWICRTIHENSPWLTSLREIRDDSQYANRWKFDGAPFQGTIRTVVTARSRRGGGYPGFSSYPFLRYAGNADEMLDNQLPTQPAGEGTSESGKKLREQGDRSEVYPFSFVGWKCTIVDRKNRVGYYKVGSSGAKTTTNFEFGGGSRDLPPDHKGRTESDIIYWEEVANRTNFRTQYGFPGAKTSYETVNTTSEAIVVELTPNGRVVERIVEIGKEAVWGSLNVAVGARTEFISSADVIGWVQAGIAAQVKCFHSRRSALVYDLEEFCLKSRAWPTVLDNRVAITGALSRMTLIGTTGNGGDGYVIGNNLSDTGARPKYGFGKLAQVRTLSLSLMGGGWRARYSLGTRSMNIADVIAKLARTMQRG